MAAKEKERSKPVKDREIAMDFAQKVYKRIGTPIKSIVLFGSSAKGSSTPKSDIDLLILIDDASIMWDQELIAWYREELQKILNQNKYPKVLHINTVRLTTWWNEMIRGEPVVINIIRWGDPLIDIAGFFTPLKSLLVQGQLKATHEMIFVTLGRAPSHLGRCKVSMITAMEAIYWAFVDASHSALIAARVSPPSPEHIPAMMRQNLAEKGIIKAKYVDWYRDVYLLTHKVLRGEVEVKGEDLELWKNRADEYIREMASTVKKITGFK